MTDATTQGNGANSIAQRGGEGGHGGRGGTGGQGGTGKNGIDGQQGEPGEPGAPGSEGTVRYLGGPISITAMVTVVLAVIAGISYIIEIKNDGSLLRREIKNEVALLRRDLEQFVDNVKNLNTPLSQRVFAIEPRVAEIGRIQAEVRARMESIDTNGTTQNKILKQSVDAMRAEITGQNIRCQDAVRRIDEVQQRTFENQIRIQNIIEALAPHELRRRK